MIRSKNNFHLKLFITFTYNVSLLQAVGLNARFLKVGAPVRGERVAQLNRLLQIEDHLKREGHLGSHGADAFPHIAPPPLPETEEGEEAQEEEKKEEKGKKK